MSQQNTQASQTKVPQTELNDTTPSERTIEIITAQMSLPKPFNHIGPVDKTLTDEEREAWQEEHEIERTYFETGLLVGMVLFRHKNKGPESKAEISKLKEEFDKEAARYEKDKDEFRGRIREAGSGLGI